VAATVETGSPAVTELPQKVERHAATPVTSGQFVRPANSGKAVPEIIKIDLIDCNAKGVGIARARSCSVVVVSAWWLVSTIGNFFLEPLRVSLCL